PEMDLPSPNDAGAEPTPADGDDQPLGDSTGLEAPEPPEMGDAAGLPDATDGLEGVRRQASGFRRQEAADGWQGASDDRPGVVEHLPAREEPSFSEEIDAEEPRSIANAPASVPSTVQLVPADGGWRSGRKRR
ncbi:MAG: hypothetical protein ACREHD_01730, partial [Pirellulales bacterium]